jgi:hypothetical protein
MLEYLVNITADHDEIYYCTKSAIDENDIA